ncbi:acyl-CoA dehydrogenase family protein [Streptomyces subrutilus]|uniref:acyl-CoA dehydrogenase family protein n=1 Tax=Streptomyces subrutilus TaxID=36818 RepID=UPI003F4E0645
MPLPDGPRHARLGGWGYSREYPVEQWMRDAKLEEREEGTSDIMRIVISRHLP